MGDNVKFTGKAPADRRVLPGPEQGVEFVPDQAMLDEEARLQAEQDALDDAFEKEFQEYVKVNPNIVGCKPADRWYVLEAVSVDTIKELLKNGYDPSNPKHVDVFEPRRKDLGWSYKRPVSSAKRWERGGGPVNYSDDPAQNYDDVKKYPNDPMVLLHLANIKRAQEILAEEAETAKESALDQAALQETTEQFPECPMLPGALTDLARAIYPSLPLEFKMWGLITRWGLYRSGLDRLAVEPHLQSRFFAVLVALPNRGKTACINESRTSMKLITDMATEQCGKATKPRGADVECLASADSGPFLVEYLYDKTRKVKDDFMSSITHDDRAKVILDSDELSDVFEKAKSSMSRTSTLFTELLKLHSGNRTGNGTRRTGDMPVDRAHLSVLSGTTVKKYPMLWTGTGGGGDGLVSRFIAITTNASQVPPVPLQTDTVAAMQAYDRLVKLSQLPGQTITLSDEAAKVLTDWWYSFDNSKESASRILETVKQLLIVLAVTNAPEGHAGESLTVGVDLVRSATAFGDYEIAIREMLNPGDSWTHVQAMEVAIIKWAEKNAKPEARSMRDFRRGINPQRLPGGLGTFLLAWKNCVESGMLKFHGKVGKSSLYRL